MSYYCYVHNWNSERDVCPECLRVVKSSKSSSNSSVLIVQPSDVEGSDAPKSDVQGSESGEFPEEEATMAFWNPLRFQNDPKADRHSFVEGARWMFDRMRGGKK